AAVRARERVAAGILEPERLARKPGAALAARATVTERPTEQLVGDRDDEQDQGGHTDEPRRPTHSRNLHDVERRSSAAWPPRRRPAHSTGRLAARDGLIPRMKAGASVHAAPKPPQGTAARLGRFLPVGNMLRPLFSATVGRVAVLPWCRRTRGPPDEA